MRDNVAAEGRSGGTLLKLSDASRRLGVAYQTLFNAVASGKVPAQRDAGGSRWYVRAEDLAAVAVALGVEVPA